MNGTPRLRSAFPTTPQHVPGHHRPARPSSLANGIRRKTSLPPAQNFGASSTSPVIPLDILDGATQRRFAVGLYLALFAWKLSEWWTLYTSDDTESVWLFMKWIFIDGLYLFGLPILRIPWLEWSSSTMTISFFAHAFLNLVLMFKWGLPLGALFEWSIKKVWDQEMAVSERRVKTQSVVDTSALLQGRHIINILPEGSAILNPNSEIFCVGGDTIHVTLPIQINQTQPVLMELLRRDLDGEGEEIITIKASESKKLRKTAVDAYKKAKGQLSPTDPLILRYSVKKPGQYTIQKIVDESKLEVRPRPSEVVVVSCPSAKVISESVDRCRGDLSDISFAVEGAAPLKLKYRKLVSGKTIEASFQSIQPSGFVAPHSRGKQLTTTKASTLDISWAQSQQVIVPINETMLELGTYNYVIDEVQDSLGNRVVYFNRQEDDLLSNSKHPEVSKAMTVFDRPAIWIDPRAGCNRERPLKVAAGQEVDLPHVLGSAGQINNRYTFAEEHTIEYVFYPESSLGDEDESSQVSKGVSRTLRKRKESDTITLKEPGLYVIKDVFTKHCRGEVSEPSSCLLQNPAKPEVKITSSEITHRCANSPIGLRIGFDFEGTPPFVVRYMEQQDGRNPRQRIERFKTHRGQIEIRQDDAGRYKYTFQEIGDAYYESQKIHEVLEQDVKPSASAHITEASKGNVCLGQSANFTVKLVGEAPWTLEYEVIHGKTKKKHTINDVTNPAYEIQLADFADGGEYTLSLTSVTDASKCKETLKDATSSFNVWSQRPTAAFGKINGKRSASMLEGKAIKLPVQFTGQGSFSYQVVQVEGDKAEVRTGQPASTTFDVTTDGTYVLNAMSDQYCFGDVDPNADKFIVSWIPRPALSIAQSPVITEKSGRFDKQDVCEGEEDNADIVLEGAPPFDITYEKHAKPDDSSKFMKRYQISSPFGLASIPMDTAKAGTYEYRFLELSDSNYDPLKSSKPITVLNHRVRSRPKATFTNPGTVYNFCTTSSPNDESIPIKLTGTPPFSIDLDIRHTGSASPESMTLEKIESNTYDLKLPRHYLKSGVSNLSIRRVRDAFGCQSKVDTTAPPSRVHVSVHEPPNITPIEKAEDYCVGERISFRLTGVPPFTVHYTFGGEKRKASEKTTEFTRFNADAGTFVITSISDASSKCQFTTHLQKVIHPLPGVKISSGRETHVDIHEGGESDVVFELIGTPPFELTYTRSEYTKKGRKGLVLETKTERTEERTLRAKESEGGEYEPVAVRDKWCLTDKSSGARAARKGQKLLQ
ncbi:hypothetical protein BT63DRAFT_447806 [Microthyrium microscopicum]|uniref:Nucleoporin Pom152 n=1 Tax=Microthyrium microscopicum TaxID=703497 RepID=A0A6A6U565_9PEZI|nr:hypothetical protein BT63DRAFT_447806 [Microthyrium microscopicum]